MTTAVARIGELCRGFSQPGGGLDDAVLDAIVVAHARASVAQFLTVHAAPIDAAAPGLGDTLRAWWAAPRERPDALDRAVGDAAAAVCDPGLSPVRVAAQLGLWAAARGAVATWSLRSREPLALWWDRSALPPLRALDVVSDGEVAHLRLRTLDGACAEAVYTRGAPGDGRQPARVGELWLLAEPDLPPDLQPLAFFRGGRPAPAIHPAAAQSLADGVALLTGALPWRAWVCALVKEVILLVPPTATRSISGSSSDMPGLVAISSADALRTAEMLVHESTHLYFHVATRLGPVQDGSDAALYYSPAVGRERPLHRVLLAYHAFGNVLVWYRGLLAQGGAPEGAAEQATRLRVEVAQLEAPLRGHAALTAVGRALFEPLACRLAETE